ncbi:MAG: LPS export ABC transporter periplasmic protein LptC [Abditibacteriota bacterium]|nr:LPS export ABC transporter periplasmic protein LptC [Abditibacteriota bacterium]
MKKALILILAALAISSSAFAATYKSSDGRISFSAPALEYGNYKVSAKGNAVIDASDKAKGTALTAKAANVSIGFYSSKNGSKTGIMGTIKSAEFSGGITITYKVTDAEGTPITTVATADRATYTGADNIMTLEGNVKIVHTNPAVFTEPTILTGDTAKINMKPNIGPDDFKFRVEAKEGVSRIEAHPIIKVEESEE